MNAKVEQMVKIAYDAFEDKKGQDIKILKISNISTIADYCRRTISEKWL